MEIATTQTHFNTSIQGVLHLLELSLMVPGTLNIIIVEVRMRTVAPATTRPSIPLLSTLLILLLLLLVVVELILEGYIRVTRCRRRLILFRGKNGVTRLQNKLMNVVLPNFLLDLSQERQLKKISDLCLRNKDEYLRLLSSKIRELGNNKVCIARFVFLKICFGSTCLFSGPLRAEGAV